MQACEEGGEAGEAQSRVQGSLWRCEPRFSWVVTIACLEGVRGTRVFAPIRFYRIKPHSCGEPLDDEGHRLSAVPLSDDSMGGLSGSVFPVYRPATAFGRSVRRWAKSKQSDRSSAAASIAPSGSNPNVVSQKRIRLAWERTASAPVVTDER